jgi:hypothetical protein
MPQNLQTNQASHSIRHLGTAELAHGLGPATERPQMGEPADGLAVLWRRYARHTPEVPNERRGGHVRGETGVRILRARAAGEESGAESVCKQLHSRAGATEAY